MNLQGKNPTHEICNQINTFTFWIFAKFSKKEKFWWMNDGVMALAVLGLFPMCDHMGHVFFLITEGKHTGHYVFHSL